MSSTPAPCIDRTLPLELTGLAEQAAAIRPANQRSALEAVGDCFRFWPTGMNLRVRFLDFPELAPRVMAAAQAWTEQANLFFEVVADGPAEIRLTFDDASGGNWSAVGTDALVPEYFPTHEPTMCLSEVLAPESQARVDQIVRHEFGHAIGLLHEHSSPTAGIPWDKPVVYAAMAEPPNAWSREVVDHNMFVKYSEKTTNYSAFDPASIMLYAIPPAWTRNRMTFPNNTSLSPTDVEFIRRFYPGHP